MPGVLPGIYFDFKFALYHGLTAMVRGLPKER